MKFKDLPKDAPILGIVLYIPKRYQLDQGIPQEKMYVFSGWYRGLWLKTSLDVQRIYPLTVDSWKDIENWKVISPFTPQWEAYDKLQKRKSSVAKRTAHKTKKKAIRTKI